MRVVGSIVTTPREIIDAGKPWSSANPYGYDQVDDKLTSMRAYVDHAIRLLDEERDQLRVEREYYAARLTELQALANRLFGRK